MGRNICEPYAAHFTENREIYAPACIQIQKINVQIKTFFMKIYGIYAFKYNISVMLLQIIRQSMNK